MSINWNLVGDPDSVFGLDLVNVIPYMTQMLVTQYYVDVLGSEYAYGLVLVYNSLTTEYNGIYPIIPYDNGSVLGYKYGEKYKNLLSSYYTYIQTSLYGNDAIPIIIAGTDGGNIIYVGDVSNILSEPQSCLPSAPQVAPILSIFISKDSRKIMFGNTNRQVWYDQVFDPKVDNNAVSYFNLPEDKNFQTVSCNDTMNNYIIIAENNTYLYFGSWTGTTYSVVFILSSSTYTLRSAIMHESYSFENKDNRKIIITQTTGSQFYLAPQTSGYKIQLIPKTETTTQKNAAVSIDRTFNNLLLCTSGSGSQTVYATTHYLGNVFSLHKPLGNEQVLDGVSIPYDEFGIYKLCAISPYPNVNTDLPDLSLYLNTNTNGSGLDGGIYFSINAGGSCFIAGTKILALIDGVETEVNVENLRSGVLVKTHTGEYKPIKFIGYNEIDVVKNLNYIRVMKKDAIKENFPNSDLFVVSGHSLLFDNLDYANDNFTPEIYNNNIASYYKIMSSQCKLFDVATVESIITKVKRNHIKYYHFCLEDKDNDAQFGVYSNGVLSETMSINYSRKSGLISLDNTVSKAVENKILSDEIVC
jgi:Hint domain